MTVKDEEATAVLSRALEAGYFEGKEIWSAAGREEVKRMARELLDDPEAVVRIWQKAYDRYPEVEGVLTGDLERTKDSSSIDHFLVEKVVR